MDFDDDDRLRWPLRTNALGGLPERLRSGLQNRLHGFESRTHLQNAVTVSIATPYFDAKRLEIAQSAGSAARIHETGTANMAADLRFLVFFSFP